MATGSRDPVSRRALRQHLPATVQEEKKPVFLASFRRPLTGPGSSTRRGGGQKLRALPRKFVFLGFRREESGMSREFCRDVPDPWRCSKSLCKKTSCAFFVPYLRPEKLSKRFSFGGGSVFFCYSLIGSPIIVQLSVEGSGAFNGQGSGVSLRMLDPSSPGCPGMFLGVFKTFVLKSSCAFFVPIRWPPGS